MDSKGLFIGLFSLLGMCKRLVLQLCLDQMHHAKKMAPVERPRQEIEKKIQQGHHLLAKGWLQTKLKVGRSLFTALQLKAFSRVNKSMFQTCGGGFFSLRKIFALFVLVSSLGPFRPSSLIKYVDTII